MAIYRCRKHKSVKPDPMDGLTIREQADQALYHSPFHPHGSSTVMIKVQNMPTFQLIRNVSFDRLDIVVSIGGIIGLFFGASIIGFAEIIYIWILRKCWTLCLFHTMLFLVWHILFENKKKCFFNCISRFVFILFDNIVKMNNTALIFCVDKQITDTLTNIPSLTEPIFRFEICIRYLHRWFNRMSSNAANTEYNGLEWYDGPLTSNKRQWYCICV